ncbi:MAG: hypothetical protein LC802_22050, partial [Acidobacteria bacterium]|nr:hypothetical protein [Acidobacteriota bacterium]
ASSPQSFNRYTYVNNDPVNHVDPTGLRLQDIGVHQTENPAVAGRLERAMVTYVRRYVEGQTGAAQQQQRAQQNNARFMASSQSAAIKNNSMSFSGETGSAGATDPQGPCLGTSFVAAVGDIDLGQGFTQDIVNARGQGTYTAGELNTAMYTVYGELSTRQSMVFSLEISTDANAIAATIVNRSQAVKNKAEGYRQFGESSNLIDIIASGGYAGDDKGRRTWNQGQDINQGGRNCVRMIAAFNAVGTAAKWGAQYNYLFMYSASYAFPGQNVVRHADNVFSTTLIRGRTAPKP